MQSTEEARLSSAYVLHCASVHIIIIISCISIHFILITSKYSILFMNFMMPHLSSCDIVTAQSL